MADPDSEERRYGRTPSWWRRLRCNPQRVLGGMQSANLTLIYEGGINRSDRGCGEGGEKNKQDGASYYPAKEMHGSMRYDASVHAGERDGTGNSRFFFFFGWQRDHA